MPIFSAALRYLTLDLTLHFQKSFQSISHFTTSTTNSASGRWHGRSRDFHPVHRRLWQNFRRRGFTELCTCIHRCRRRFRQWSARLRGFKHSGRQWRPNGRTDVGTIVADLFEILSSIRWLSKITAAGIRPLEVWTCRQRNEIVVPYYNLPASSVDLGFDFL